MKKLILFLSLFLASVVVLAQADTVEIASVSDTSTLVQQSALADSVVANPQLLPERYLLTQRLLWSEHGAMRYIPGFEYSEKNRNKEVVYRHYMLKAHRFLGYGVLAGMLGQALTGIQLYNGNTQYKDLHEGLAAYTNIVYFTSGGLMLFAPPWKSDRAPGYSNTKAHKYLSFVHISCMIASNMLADVAEKPGLGRDMHRATAYIAFGTYFVSTVVIHF